MQGSPADGMLTKREEDVVNERIFVASLKIKFPDGDVDVEKWIECLEEAKLRAPDETFVVLCRDRGAPLAFHAYRYPTQAERDLRRKKIISTKQAAARAAVKRANQRNSDFELMLELARRNPMCFTNQFLLTNGIERE